MRVSNAVIEVGSMSFGEGHFIQGLLTANALNELLDSEEILETYCQKKRRDRLRVRSDKEERRWVIWDTTFRRQRVPLQGGEKDRTPVMETG